MHWQNRGVEAAVVAEATAGVDGTPANSSSDSRVVTACMEHRMTGTAYSAVVSSSVSSCPSGPLLLLLLLLRMALALSAEALKIKQRAQRPSKFVEFVAAFMVSDHMLVGFAIWSLPCGHTY
jgi:hypothetical protein